MQESVRIPPCPFASVHWFRLAGTAPVLDVHSYYVKQSYRNRFVITGVNGKVTLTFPVEGQKGQKTPLVDIRIVQGNWVRQHLGAIRSAYGRAAFFEYYIEEIEAIYRTGHTYLADLSLDTLHWYRRAGISIDFSISTAAVPFESDDISRQLEPGFTLPDYPPYPQVFSDRQGFTGGLSLLDVLMHKGPGAQDYLLAL